MSILQETLIFFNHFFCYGSHLAIFQCDQMQCLAPNLCVLLKCVRNRPTRSPTPETITSKLKNHTCTASARQSNLHGCIFTRCYHNTEYNRVEDYSSDGTSMTTQRVFFWRSWNPFGWISLRSRRTANVNLLNGFLKAVL